MGTSDRQLCDLRVFHLWFILILGVLGQQMYIFPLQDGVGGVLLRHGILPSFLHLQIAKGIVWPAKVCRA